MDEARDVREGGSERVLLWVSVAATALGSRRGESTIYLVGGN